MCDIGVGMRCCCYTASAVPCGAHLLGGGGWEGGGEGGEEMQHHLSPVLVQIAVSAVLPQMCLCLYALALPDRWLLSGAVLMRATGWWAHMRLTLALPDRAAHAAGQGSGACAPTIASRALALPQALVNHMAAPKAWLEGPQHIRN